MRKDFLRKNGKSISSSGQNKLKSDRINGLLLREKMI